MNNPITPEEARKQLYEFRVQRLEGLIQNALKSMQEVTPSHWLHAHFKARYEDYQVEYKLLTGREYDGKM